MQQPNRSRWVALTTKENDVKFTKEQLRGIDQVRSRLEAYRDRIQPYPESEHSIIETSEPERVTTIYTRINIDNKALELQKRIVTLEEEIKELKPYAKAKPKYKY